MSKTGQYVYAEVVPNGTGKIIIDHKMANTFLDHLFKHLAANQRQL